MGAKGNIDPILRIIVPHTSIIIKKEYSMSFINANLGTTTYH